MALRTVTLEFQQRELPLPPPEWRHRVDRLLEQAAAAIAAGRLNELRPLFADLDGWEPQRAYQARRQLVELALSTAGLAEAAWIRLFLTVAEALLDTLDAEPAEPVLLNYAGVLLYEVAELGGAEALFKAAARLDPRLEHVDRNLEQVRRRKRGHRSPLRGPAAAQARALGARARRVAAAARPADGLTISLTMIVKDEEEMLPGCLEAVAGAVDEMIVVDTGSSDHTVEIAESFGAKVVHFPWNGSFADARNVSLEHATGDWILYLDADEHLVREDAHLFRDLLGRTWREGFYLVETNYTGGEDTGSAVAHLALRLFRNRPEYRFEGRIHEQKTQRMPTYLPERFETTPIRLHHYGYLKSRIGGREKSQRNLQLLLQEAREKPGDPFVGFNLGSEYLMLGEFHRAREHFASAWQTLQANPGVQAGYRPILAARLAQSQREDGDPSAARGTIDEALAIWPDHTELVLQAAMCARDERDLDEAARLAERCLELGDAPAKYSAAVGSGTYLALMLLAEIRTLQGRRADAETLYRRSLEEHPAYIGPLLPLAGLEIARGVEPSEVCVRLADERPSAGLLLATALYEGGRAADAEARFRAVLALQPANGVARIGLVETLLARRQYAEATAEARLEPDGSPIRRLAAASELFALAAAGDADGLDVALGSAAAHGVAPHDVELYRGWLTLLRGGEPPASLSAAAAHTAFTALEALLRIVDVDAFAQLHVLAQRLAIDPRERREALARMYLRRGFLDSAAEEWLTVAKTAPDVRAYVGLAQVSVARGLDEDARAFAAAARRADPSSAAAARLCTALEARAAA